MKRDYKAACTAAVNALYEGDEDSMRAALFEILEALDPHLAELMQDNEDAARAKVNGEEIDDEEESY